VPDVASADADVLEQVVAEILRACGDVGSNALDIREKTFCCACHELTPFEV
jgi:hypothetical protein